MLENQAGVCCGAEGARLGCIQPAGPHQSKGKKPRVLFLFLCAGRAGGREDWDTEGGEGGAFLKEGSNE